MATDGGSKDNVGDFGVVAAKSDVSFASGDDSDDQPPFRQEVNAIGFAAKGIIQAGKHVAKGHVALLTAN